MNPNPIATTLFKMLEAFCQFPEDIEVSSEPSGNADHFSIRCHCEDLRRIIGKSGCMFKALRYLVAMLGEAYHGPRAVLLPVSGTHGTHARLEPASPEPSDSFPEEEMELARFLAVRLNKSAEVKYSPPNTAIITIDFDDQTLQDIERALNTLFQSISAKSGRKLSVKVEKYK